jgi:hypothetical protein
MAIIIINNNFEIELLKNYAIIITNISAELQKLL